MRSSLLYRIASVLILLFAIGHTLGFRNVDPRWGIDSTIASMKTIHFNAQGFQRTYWDFYAGFGFFVTLFLLLAAIMAWQLGSFSRPMVSPAQSLAWALTASFAILVFLSWRYFFIAPVIFSSVIFLCLLGATLMSARNH